jgi:hypothetical protein
MLKERVKLVDEEEVSLWTMPKYNSMGAALWCG